MGFCEKQLFDESNHCNSEAFCKNCQPELRRLELKVNELKLTNDFLKESLQTWKMQCEPNICDADLQNLSGELSNRGRSSMDTLSASEAYSSNSPKTTLNVQTYNTCSSLSPASKALADLQKKLTELTEQYRLLALKYNGMVWRLQDCQDALHCSSKQSYELEKVNLELQIKLKEIMQIRHSRNEEIFVQKLGITPAYTSPSIRATLQKNSKEGSGQVYALNASMPDSTLEGAVPAAACEETVTFNYNRSNIMPMPITEPCNASCEPPPSGYVNPPGNMHTQQPPIMSMHHGNMKAQIGNDASSEPPPSGYVNPPGYMHTQQPPIVSMPHVNMKMQIGIDASSEPPLSGHVNVPTGYMHSQQPPIMSMPHVNTKVQIGNAAAPSNHNILLTQPAHTDGGFPHHCGAATCESGWNWSSSKLSPTNTVTMERSTPKKQQSSRQYNIPLSYMASPSDQCRLRDRNLKGADESFSGITKADRSPGPACPSIGANSPTACRQSYDQNDPSAINVPKMISIRVNSHNSNSQKTHKGAARDAAPVRSPSDHHKPRHHRGHSTPIRNEVEKEMKVVALTENLECMAFPQGMYKTEMCNKWVRNMGQYCPYGAKCQFAHGPHELRPVLRHRSYKTILCRMVAAGEPCPYEHRCHFRHVILPHEAELLSRYPISSSS